jgi:hypothetical protein
VHIAITSFLLCFIALTLDDDDERQNLSRKPPLGITFEQFVRRVKEEEEEDKEEWFSSSCTSKRRSKTSGKSNSLYPSLST